jgi:hypothetical protein
VAQDSAQDRKANSAEARKVTAEWDYPKEAARGRCGGRGGLLLR